jgi:hypothetical protein
VCVCVCVCVIRRGDATSWPNLRPVHLQANVHWPGNLNKRCTKKPKKQLVKHYVDKKGRRRVVGQKALTASAFASQGSDSEVRCVLSDFSVSERVDWNEALPDPVREDRWAHCLP